MASSELHRFDECMRDMIALSEEVNLAVARGKPAQEVARMGRLSLWLALVFAFDGFIQGASRVFGTENRLRSMKDSEPQQPDVVLRLKLLYQERGLDLELPGESATDVIARHFRLRNKWAHSLGVMSTEDPAVSRIVCWDGPGHQAWVNEAGWSELRNAVGNVCARVLQLRITATHEVVHEGRGAVVITGKLQLPVGDGASLDLSEQHIGVLLNVIPAAVESCRGMLAFWHASRHCYPLYRCRANQLVEQLVNEIWLQCLPNEGRGHDLTMALKHELEHACGRAGVREVPVRVQVADEAVVFDEQLAEIGGLESMPKLWAEAQEASERAIQDLELGQRTAPDPAWCPWATHIYENIVSAVA